MRTLVVVAGLVLSSSACERAADVVGANPRVEDAIVLMQSYRDKICACTDSACSDHAFDEYKARAKDSIDQLDHDKVKADVEQSARIDEVAKQIGRCVVRLRAPKN